MNAPRPLEEDPLSVACETCREPAGFPCVEWDYDDGPTIVRPHAARIRAASPLPGGKEKT